MNAIESRERTLTSKLSPGAAACMLLLPAVPALAAAARYGTPSNAPDTLPMQWCARPSARPGIGGPADDARFDLSQGQQTVQPRL